MGSWLVLPFAVVLGCGAAPAVLPEPTTEGASETEPVAIEAVEVAEAEPTAGTVTCVEVSIGIDLRAYPVGTRPSDLRNRGEADDLRHALPGEPEPEMFVSPGWSGFSGRFTRATEVEARDACRRAVAIYLEDAPRMPISMEPAAHVTTDCAPCAPR